MDGYVKTGPHCSCTRCEANLTETTNQLRQADFAIGYAFPQDAERFGYLNSSTGVSFEWYAGSRVHHVDGAPSEHYGIAYVDLGAVAYEDDNRGHGDTVKMSNYRSLRRDFPQVPWVDTSYSNTNTLGVFVRDLGEDMVNLLIGLVEQYSVYDESDLSELESDQIDESWAGWLRSDLWSELGHLTPMGSDTVRTVMWDGLGEELVTDLFWSAVSQEWFGSNVPEHSGSEIMWGDLGKLAARLRELVIRAYWTKRRGLAIDSPYDFVRLIIQYA